MGQTSGMLATNEIKFIVAGDSILTVGAIVTFVMKLQNGVVVGVEAAKSNGQAAEHSELNEKIDDDDEALDAVDAIIEGKKEIKETDERISPAHAPYFPGVSSRMTIAHLTLIDCHSPPSS